MPKNNKMCLNGLSRWLSGKESACQDTGETDLIPGSGRSPGGGNGDPLQYSCLENPLDREALAGYSPLGHKESDMTKDTCKDKILSELLWEIKPTVWHKTHTYE